MSQRQDYKQELGTHGEVLLKERSQLELVGKAGSQAPAQSTVPESLE